jgi:CheY-like chemotaxis protein
MLRIILVEDSPADAHMLQIALRGSSSAVSITWLNDGIRASEYLSQDSGKAARAKHDLVILDLNLPGISGFELLELIRGNHNLSAIPVVVMSGSEDSHDIDRCYRLGANSYVRKYTQIGEIFAAAQQFLAYWSTCVTLPSVKPPILGRHANSL